MLGHSLHQFHEHDLFTSAAAMSYFGLMALFPALLLMLAISNKLAAGSELLSHAVDVYPGSAKFLRETIGAFSELSIGAIITCVIIVLWAGSWVFAVVERAVNRIWGTTSRTFLHGRAMTIGMVGVIGLILAFSVGVDFNPRRASRNDRRFVAASNREVSAADVGWQCVLASVVFRRQLSHHSSGVYLYLSFYAAGGSHLARHAAGRVSRRLALGDREVHFCVEPAILPLR